MIKKQELRCNVRGLVVINLLALLPAVVAAFFFPLWSVAGLFLVWLFALAFSVFQVFRVVLHDDFLVVQYPLTPWRARCIPKGAIRSVAVIAVQRRHSGPSNHHLSQGLSERQFEPQTMSRTSYRTHHYVQISLTGSAPLRLGNFEHGHDQACFTINQWLGASAT